MVPQIGKTSLFIHGSVEAVFRAADGEKKEFKEVKIKTFDGTFPVHFRSLDAVFPLLFERNGQLVVLQGECVTEPARSGEKNGKKWSMDASTQIGGPVHVFQMGADGKLQPLNGPGASSSAAPQRRMAA